MDSQYLSCRCAWCSGKIEFPEHGLGQHIECPHCQKTTRLKRPRKVLVTEWFYAFTALCLIAGVFFLFASKDESASARASELGGNISALFFWFSLLSFISANVLFYFCGRISFKRTLLFFSLLLAVAVVLFFSLVFLIAFLAAKSRT